MADPSTTTLSADSQLLLEQPLLRLPHELLRKNLKSAQRQIEIANKAITTSIASLTPDSSPADTLAALDATLLKAQTLKRKLEALHAEETTLHRQQKARIEHLAELHEIPSLADVKYDRWAQTRLDRLLVDYLLRQNYLSSARQLAAAKGIDDLVDIPTFSECSRISSSLRNGDVKEALSWCTENKQALKKIGSTLELELRLQQFIELARTGEMGKLMEAIVHARKHLVGGADTEFGLRAGGLLAHPVDTLVEPYRNPHHLQTSSAAMLTDSPICPICSTELNELATGVPYAHHTKSSMESDSVVLPNGRVFGRERLRVLNQKLGVQEGRIRDPTEGVRGSEWGVAELRKVFIT
ncbi:GID complex subunit containing RING finger motif [Elasticomyces elasticus]|nr:GID complex subunit containing RING finger motif [Elasticomyces elasticus]